MHGRQLPRQCTHPLPDLPPRNDVFRQPYRRVAHSTAHTRRAKPSTLAAQRHKSFESAIRTLYPDKPIFENPTTQILVDVTLHKLRQTPDSLESLAKIGPVRRDSPIQHRLLRSMLLVWVLLCVFRMTFGCKHARELCAPHAKRFASCFPDGFTWRPLAAAMAEPGGRHPAARCSFLCAPTQTPK